jgi:DNA-binding LacI/PurR family transcriptional regulator
MSTPNGSPSNIGWLAKRLEEDIQTRGLRPGEPYLTSAQLGRQLGISKSMAYRAMKILAARRVLVSHPGRGTFVGPQAGSLAAGRLKSIHVLTTQDYFQTAERLSFGCLAGLSATLPGYGIQFDFLPLCNTEAHVGQLLEQGLTEGTLAAVVLLGCTRSIQEQVLRRGLPALVLGTDYSSTRQLPSIDADQYEIGRLAAGYLLARGCRRIALLMREMWFPGDQLLFEGVGRALDEAGLGHEALILRNLAADAALLTSDLHRLLTAKNRPAGCLCRMPFFAQAVIRTARSAGLKIPADLEVICDSLQRHTAAQWGLPGICMKVEVEGQVALGGQMLKLLLNGQRPDPLHVVLPVELVEPNRQYPDRPKPGGRKRGSALRKLKSGVV